MAQPAAKQGDRIVGTDMHLIQPPSPGPPAPVPHPFSGIIDGNLSSTVLIEGRPAATMGSTATNLPPHIPQGGTFVRPPTNRGTIQMGSPTVLIDGKPAARNGDTAMTCNDPVDAPMGTVVSTTATVLMG
jgi:uncharacterized Zn-binding protein involved in type VI secretion